MKYSRKALVGIVVVIAAIGVALFSNRKQNVPPQGPATETVSTQPTTDEVKVTETPVEEKPAAALPKSALKLAPRDQRKLVILQQILESKNDNDSRMDKDLLDLSPEVKRAMEGYYHEMDAEKRNDRGTVVFLVGRKISSKEDVEFLKSVLMEKPCQSLSDCSKTDAPSSGEAAHLEGINETTANYPQLMAIRQMTEQYRLIQGTQGADQNLASGIVSALKDATRSPNAKVQNDAELALKYLTGKR